MPSLPPHYLLFAETHDDSSLSRWRFVLKAADGTDHIEVEDTEPAARGERLALLAVVRALEALDQPSRVTLAACPEYVRRGLVYGLDEWRRQGWRWEWFGQLVPVKNGDLWQRVDRALTFHRLETPGWRFDRPHPMPRGHLSLASRGADGPAGGTQPWPAERSMVDGRLAAATCAMPQMGPKWAGFRWLPRAEAARRLLHRCYRRWQWLVARLRRAVREAASKLATRLGQMCLPITAPPWYL